MKANKKISGIYKITHRSTGMKYIGRSIDIHRRVKEHKLGGNGRIAEAIANCGWGAFILDVVEECGTEQMREKEILWIKKEDCIHPKGFNLLSAGGDAKNTSDETRRKMSVSHTGKKQPADVVAKRIASRLASEIGKGYQLSPETIEKREATKKANGSNGWKWSEAQKAAKSEQMKGKKASDETRKKLSDAHMGKPRSPEICKAISLGRIKAAARKKYLESMQGYFTDVRLEFPGANQ